ncbi:MAG: hypothetical protein FJX76_08180, partial [Armatimonadetes bacterium]|nr:hypothetical protein [Armatimonadota bacterium]
RIGMDAFADSSKMIAWATALQDGAPLTGVSVRLFPRGGSAETANSGLAELELPDDPATLLVARLGNDMAIMPRANGLYGGGWQRVSQIDALRWFVFDDRQMYRPGETVHVKGWVRRMGRGQDGDLSLVAGSGPVRFTMLDSRGNEVRKGDAKLSALGGFDFRLSLPKTMNLGSARISLALAAPDAHNVSIDHAFQVQEFRRPEFEVKATASEGPFYLGGHADVSVDAHYYSGGALPNAQVTWNVEAVGSSFTPPNWGEFSFGTWTPWWVYDFGGRPGIAGTSKSFQGKTGADGIHRLRMDFDACRPPRATSVTATATVMDVNRQAWTSSTSVLVHPSKLYVGLKTEKAFVQPGDPIDLQIIVADVDGKAARGTDVSLRLSRREWTWSDGEYRDEEVDVQEKTVVSAAEPAPVSFTVKGGGEYRLIARIVDAEGLPNESEISVWVPGGKQPPQRGVQQEKVTVIPDHKTYKIGDTASLLVQSPIFPAEGLMTVRRNGIARSERFRMEESTITLKVPISEHDLPSLEVAVDLVGAAQRTDDDGSPAPDAPKRPAYATGSVSLAVPPVSRTLTVAAAPKDKALGPGESTSVEVDVKGPDGKPVADAEVAVIVVDEAVLALTGYKLGDPINAFYVAAGGGVTASHLRGSLILVEASTITEGAKPAPGGAANGRSRNGAMDEMKREEYGGGEVMAGAPPPPPAPGPMQEARPVASAAEPAPDQPTTPMAVRSNFDPLATWAPAVKTDANGHASVPVKLPDNLTRYRVMAVAVAEAKFFGTGESSLTARLPLMVRPSAPRFLNFGDQFDLPVVVQNQTDQPLEVQVAVRASNAVLPKGNSLGLTVPANDRVEVRFPAGTDEAGTARFQIGASAGKYSDAAEVSLPVWTPATSEAFATYGEVDQGAVAQPVKAPTDVFKQFGGLEITTSSTQLQALTDAVLYLQAYPFECSEQISSRVLSVAALRDVLTAFMAEGLPTPQVMKAAMARDIERLHGIQNDDGGFPFWRKGDEAWPYVSVHVAHALARAKQKGFEVPLDMQDRCIRYLRNIESYIPHYYGIEARRAIISYALYVRHHLGDDDRPWARKLLREAGVDSLSLESLGWLLEVLTGDAASQSEIAAIRKHINNRVEETASGAHFTTHYSDGQHLLLASDRRTDAVILEALIDDQPKSDLIPKIVRDLLAHRVKGRWENTQENCFVLLALDKYFNKYEKVTPNFTARVWLGDRFAGSAAFKGRTIDEHEIDIPMAFLMEGPALRNLIIGKDGPGRLYYRIGMQYAPTDLNPPPADHGFTVERVYEAVDKPEDVRRDQDGTWHVKAGAAVRVRVTMVAPTRRHHVALVDPLPAGLEVLNPALAVTGPVPRDPKAASSNYWFWLGTWYEHQNLRDDRAEAFTSLLWEGVYDYTYVARATTPGRYVVPPPKAEEMYHPETFGRGPANVLVVE